MKDTIKDSTLIKLRKLVKKYIKSDSCWWFDADNDLRVSEFQENPFNLQDEEIERFASTSSNIDLWAFRALAYRLSVRVPRADWAWYNL